MTLRRPATRFLAATLLATAAGLAGAAGPAPATAAATTADGKEHAIFAVSDDDTKRWNLTLGNIGNAIEGLGADSADIELVVYGPGIAMLRKDSPVADRIAEAQKKGVHVYACQNSMRGYHLEQADLAPGVGIVPSGVVELIRRQHAGYAYVRS
ncbi:MAG: DsrE family protein [Burkholderiales bacterium]|jgi:intracellular sulfur oxidation DsrE/DsrF family protein|nr:DsrE family protein [Burkholderiales bacterium]